MEAVDFKRTEEKWHNKWRELGLFQTPDNPAKKSYILEMFAYPSGDIHIGHFRNYTIGDVVARYQMMRGKDILHPFGWDAFGMPAEQAAIKNKLHPREWTLNNISRSRNTLKQMGIGYDWDREVITCLPDYYKWTQWIFLQLFKKGLAYQSSSNVNWCASCQTILANEQAQDGVCWRCHNPVIRKDLEKCWFFKYTAYAERLLKDIDRLDGWPENVKIMQKNWIGKSEGAEIDFPLEGGSGKVSVFTTRPDTIYGVTFMVIAPEHPLARQLARGTPHEKAVGEYIENALRKSDRERSASKEKDGVFTGRDVVNPFSGDKVQLWVADYVLAGYGTGVVMGVPAHDQRDFLFAKKYGIPVRVVIQPPGATLDAAEMTEAYVDPGIMANSGPFDGIESDKAIARMIQYASQKGFGKPQTNYKLKDWLISRQRYWGAPIPIIHCDVCGVVPVSEKDLPVKLPDGDIELIPKGRSPLADIPAFMKVKCPRCGKDALRDPDTMDTFVCSSFYLFRYADAKNAEKPWRLEEVKKWLPVDLYIGGVEHACGHLMYFRFITKVLFDMGHLPTDEPVVRLYNHGMVLDAAGEVMSKSTGNVVSPKEIMDKWGVDVCRIAMLFFAPSDAEIRWKESGLVGANRFTNRLWEMVGHISGLAEVAGVESSSKALLRKLHQTIKKVSDAMENDLHYNTAISSIMELMNTVDDLKAKAGSSALRETAATIVLLLAPMMPFGAEELWEKLGHRGASIFKERWPAFDPAAAVEDEVEIVIQLKGKIRGRFTVSLNTPEEEVRRRALADPDIQRLLQGALPKKVIVIPNKIVNIVV